MKKIFFSLVLSIVLGFGITPTAFAAQLVIDGPTRSVPAGQVFPVTVSLDVGDDTVNAIESTLLLIPKTLRVVSVSTGQSIVDLWIKQPAVSTDGVYFSAIMPNGFGGVLSPEEKDLPLGKLFTLYLRDTTEGTFRITSRNSQIVRNDDKGSNVASSEAVFAGVIGPAATTTVREISVVDDTPPEPFEPIVTRDVSIADGAYLLIFSTTDKFSGIDHYEVKEGNGAYVRAESPYVLKNQSLHDILSVRAIDARGNERVVTIDPAEHLRSLEASPHLFLGIITAILLFVLCIIGWRTFKK